MSNCDKNNTESDCERPLESEHDDNQTVFLKATKGGRRKVGQRGRNKVSWSKEERVTLWECYIRSGWKQSKGYMKRLKEIWDGRDVSVRKLPSLLSQIKCIEEKGLLTMMERGEIEKGIRVRDGGIRENVVGGLELEDAVVSEGEGEREGEIGVDGDVMEAEGEVIDDAVVPENDGGDDNDIDMVVLRNVVHLGQEILGNGVRLVVDRIDAWRSGNKARVMTEEENGVLRKMREVFGSGEWNTIPSLKGQDRRVVMKEVKMINGLLQNLVQDNMTVTEVNRLLYTGSFVVCDRLGLIRKNRGKSLKSKKPWWQRRLEKSIEEWRKDLGRVEEIRNGVDVRLKVKEGLDRKYGLVENGTIHVSTLKFIQGVQRLGGILRQI